MYASSSLRFFSVPILIEFVRSDYVNVATFSAYSPQGDDYFGRSVSLAMNGDTLIAASSYQNEGVEMFRSLDYGQSWEYFQTITYPDMDVSKPIQISTSDDGNELVLGLLIESGGNINQGSAYLFSYADGQYVQSGQAIIPPESYFINQGCASDGSYNQNGAPIALSGDGRYAFASSSCYQINFPPAGFLDVADIIKEEIGGILFGNNVFPLSIASNYDGSKVVFGSGPNFYIYTRSDYLEKYNSYGNPDSLSLSNDGSILAIGSCGYCVCIYNMANLTSPRQILTSPDGAYAYFGCSVELSNDGTRIIVGSNFQKSNGLTYVYNSVGGVFILDTRLAPPKFDQFYGGGGIAIITTPQNLCIILVGCPTSGIGPNNETFGQIAVFRSVTASVSATATATASSTSSATSSSTSSSSATFSSTSSSSSTATSSSSATSTYSSTATATTMSPILSTIPNSPSNALASNSFVFEATAGIAISGGILGSLIGFFIFRWLRERAQTKEAKIESINSANPAVKSLLYSS